MTQPNPSTPPDSGQAGGQQDGGAAKRYRPGQVVAYRVTDTSSGDQLKGHALVLKVTGDQVDLALLGTGHLSTHADNVSPAKVDDVPNPLPAPEPAAEAPAGS